MRKKNTEQAAKPQTPPPAPPADGSSVVVSEDRAKTSNKTSTKTGSKTGAKAGSKSSTKTEAKTSTKTDSTTSAKTDRPTNPYANSLHEDSAATQEPADSTAADNVAPEKASTDNTGKETSSGSAPAKTDASDAEAVSEAKAAKLAAKAEKKAQREAARAAAREARTARLKERERLRDEAAEIPAVRRVKLTVSRISPMSAMKVGFLVSVALSIVMLVASIVLWLVLDLLHVFSSLQVFLQAVGATALVDLMDVLAFSRSIALVAIYGVIQIVILTVLAWLSAVIYNLIARMVGGLHVVLTDE